jgi:hypothetical protein
MANGKEGQYNDWESKDGLRPIACQLTTSISARLLSSASRLPGAAASTVTNIPFIPSKPLITPNNFSVFGRFRSTYSCMKNDWVGFPAATMESRGAEAFVET